MSETPGQVLARLIEAHTRYEFVAMGDCDCGDTDHDAVAAAFLAEMAKRDRCDDCGAVASADEPIFVRASGGRRCAGCGYASDDGTNDDPIVAVRRGGEGDE